MARTVGDVGVTTFNACVDARLLALPEKLREKKMGEVYAECRGVFESGDSEAIKAEVEAGKKYLKDREKEGKTPGKPGRKVTPETMAAIKQHFPQLADAFEAGTLDEKTRKTVLNAARSVARIGSLPNAAE